MSTLKLPFTRFVRQVSLGMRRAKYSYCAMQTDLLEMLKTANWKQATCSPNAITTVVNKVTETDGVVTEDGKVETPPTYTAYIDDKYDAFKQGGDADQTADSFCGYAGMSAYRFKLPQNYTSQLENIKLMFSRARYLRSGLRVAVALNNDEQPSVDWDFVRGESTTASGILLCSDHQDSEVEGVKSFGFLGQDCQTLMDSKAGEGALEFNSTDYPAIATTTKFTYLWVYLSIEDYEDRWAWYDGKTPRYYSIEGSATLIPSICSVTFTGAEHSSTDYKQFKVMTDGVLPSMASDDSGSQAHHVTVQLNGDPLPEGDLGMVVQDLINKGGYVYKVQVAPVLGNKSKSDGLQQFAAICGSGFDGTWKNLPGLLIYDCKAKKLVNKTGKDFPVATSYLPLIQDKERYPFVAGCLFNYDDSQTGAGVGSVDDNGFFMQPYMRDMENTNQHFDGVSALYSSTSQGGFFTFHYDQNSTSIKSQNVTSDRTSFEWFNRFTTNIIGCPTMVETHFDQLIGTTVHNCTWMGFYEFGSGNEELFGNVLKKGGTSPGTANWMAVGLNTKMWSSSGTTTFKVQDIIPLPYAYRYRAYHEHGNRYYAAYAIKALGDISVAMGDDQSTGSYGNNLRAILQWTSGTDSSTGWPTLSASGIGTPISDIVNQGTGVFDVEHSSFNLIQPYIKSDNTIVVNGKIAGSESIEPTWMIVDQFGVVKKIDDEGVMQTMTYPQSKSFTLFMDDSALMVDPENGVKSGVYQLVDEDSIDYNQAVNGLRVAFGKFYTNQMSPIGGLSERVGASFTITKGTTVGVDGTAKNIKCWQIVATSLVVPFSCPLTFKTTKIKFDWENWESTVPEDFNCKFNVWLCRDQFILNHPKFLGNEAIYTGGTVQGCELIGTLNPRLPSGYKTQEIEIPEMTSKYATIIITAFFDQEVYPYESATQNVGIGIGRINLNLSSMSLNAIETGFKPNITLMGL